MGDVAYTLQVGRRSFGWRQAVVGRNVSEVQAGLRGEDDSRVQRSGGVTSEREVVMMFPGGGAQYVQMCRGLYEAEAEFRAVVDQCAELLRPRLGCDVREYLYPATTAQSQSSATLDDAWISQPSLFVIDYALARLWLSWGVQPAAMIGHSIGEYVAACLAGVFSLEEALQVVGARAALMRTVPSGAMLAIALPAREVQLLIGKELSVSAINAPDRCVVAGAVDRIDELERELKATEVFARRLRTSHAFHSPMMDAIVEPFIEEVSNIKLKPPRVRFISNVTGKWITEDEATDPRYWGRHLRETVRFSEGLNELSRELRAVWLEVGPGQTLSRMASGQCDRSMRDFIVPSLGAPHKDDWSNDALLLGNALARLWTSGVRIDWAAYNREESFRRISLPTYPFARKRYWIDPIEPNKVNGEVDAPEIFNEVEPAAADNGRAELSLHPRPNLQNLFCPAGTAAEQTIARIWQDALGVGPIGIDDNFFELGGDSLLAIKIIAQLKAEFERDFPIVNLYESLTIRSLIESMRLDDVKASELPERAPKTNRRNEYRSKMRALKRKAVANK